jgi:hypothetical protein
MSAPLTVAQARAIATGLNRAADAAEAAGQTEFDLTQAAFDDLDTSIDQAQAAVDAAKAQGQ